nr:hypothetical protein [Tanacetum cinerariifolium]
MVLSRPIGLGFNDLRRTLRIGFTYSHCDSSLFIYKQGTDTAYLLLYVDDIALSASYERIYAAEILERAHMVNCNPSQTPVDTESKMGDDGDLIYDPTLYCSLACAPQYLTFILLEIYYVVQQVGFHTTRRSTSGYYEFLGNNLLSWSSKHQQTLSRFSAEAEYRDVVNDVAEICWLRNLLRELHTSLPSATLVYYENV